MGKEDLSPITKAGESNEGHLPPENEDTGAYSRNSLDKETDLPTCRVCHCVESDKRGHVALGFLGIIPPLHDACKSDGEATCKKEVPKVTHDQSFINTVGRETEFVEFVSPEGEVFICNIDLEVGLCHQQDTLLELGCSCKSDLALVHYACALKWFVNHGSTVCEICGDVAKNIRTADYRKVACSLKDYEVLRERTANGELNPAQLISAPGIDPDAVAAIRRQRLSEIALWFYPHNVSSNTNNAGNSVTVSQGVSEQPLNTVTEGHQTENLATKWAVEGTGMLLATGLLTVTLAWLIAPRVGKKIAKSGLHILLGGICALTIMVFFRFFVLTRIKYGPARYYWAILFVFWFLVFGIWVSRTHGTHPS